MLTFTRRRNGQMMTTIILKRHFSRTDVAALLSWWAVLELNSNEVFTAPVLSRAALERIVRDQANQDRGEDLHAWDSETGLGYNLDGDLSAQIRSWAAQQVTALFRGLPDDEARS